MRHEPPRYHEDSNLFREALSYTQSVTDFSARLIEKDYYCSLVLKDLPAIANPQWAFKGGTCLSKVHSDFYRMSEDLDFAFSVPVDLPRRERSKMIVPMREHFSKMANRLTCLTLVDVLRGYNNSTQYVGRLSYTSVVTGHDESIKIEFSIREPILEPLEHLPARALLVDPFIHTTGIAPVEVPVLSRRETYAEKLRAALTRREPAIRDFYDIDHVVRAGTLTMDDRRLIELVRKKIAVQGNDPVDISARKYDLLAKQTVPQLKPVLREKDFSSFDLKRAFDTVAQIATAF